MPSNVPARRVVHPEYTKSWKLNGTSSKVISNAMVDLSAYNKLVVDLWYYPDFTAAPVILEFGVYTQNGSFTISQRTDNFKIETQWKDAGGTTGWLLNEVSLRGWTHITLAMDTSGTRFCKAYVNGAVSGAIAVTNTATGGANFGNLQLNIGCRNASSSFLKGNIKDVRISSFTGTWADDDAKAFYQGIIPSGYTKRLEYLGEDASTTAVDSVSAQNATLTNITYDTTIVPSITRTTAGARTNAGTRTAVPVYAQNHITYSEQFDNVIHTKTNVTVTPNAIANPFDGAVTADLITDDNTNGNHMIHQQTPTQVIKMGEQFTYSYAIKANTNRWVFLDSINGSVYFDLTNGVLGTITPTTGAQCFGKIEPIPEQAGWYIISASGTCITGLGNFFRLRMANSDGGGSYAGASNKSFYLARMWVNTGIGAAPYVQTVASAVNTGVGRLNV